MKRRSIPDLKKYQGRNPNGYFEDLPWEVKRNAYYWLHRLVNKGKHERGYVPQWLFAIYVGQAKRLARNPPTPAWGRSMLSKKGGKAVQQRYRLEGRHPTQAATDARLAALRARKEAERRKRLGLPDSPRRWFTV